MVLTVLAVQSALALSFDPRYRDFPFAPLTAAAVPFVLLKLCTAGWSARDGGGGCGRGAAAVRGVHRLERNVGQLAGAVVCRGAGAGRVQLASGTGRARLRIRIATASARSAVLYSTMPAPAASSASAQSTTDGRSRLSNADAKRYDAERLRGEQRDRGAAAGAQPVRAVGPAGDADGRLLDQPGSA